MPSVVYFERYFDPSNTLLVYAVYIFFIVSLFFLLVEDKIFKTFIKYSK